MLRAEKVSVFLPDNTASEGTIDKSTLIVSPGFRMTKTTLISTQCDAKKKERKIGRAVVIKKSFSTGQTIL